MKHALLCVVLYCVAEAWSAGQQERGRRCTPCDEQYTERGDVSNYLDPGWRGNGADNLGYDWSPKAWGGRAFPQKPKEQAPQEEDYRERRGRQMGWDQWDRADRGTEKPSCLRCGSSWDREGTGDRDKSPSETVTSPPLGVVLRSGHRISYIPSEEMNWDSRRDGFSNGASWPMRGAPWDQNRPDGFRPWDDTSRGSAGWDNSGKGYYFANKRPDSGYASNWNYGANNQNGWNGSDMKWNYGGKPWDQGGRDDQQYNRPRPQDGYGNTHMFGSQYPQQPPSGPSSYPTYERPSSGYPSNQRPSGGYPNNNHPSGGYPNNNHPSGGYPNNQQPSGGYPTRPPPSGGYPTRPSPSGGYPTRPPPSGGYPSHPGGYPSSPSPSGGYPSNQPPSGGYPSRPSDYPPSGSYPTRPPPSGGYPNRPGYQEGPSRPGYPSAPDKNYLPNDRPDPRPWNPDRYDPGQNQGYPRPDSGRPGYGIRYPSTERPNQSYLPQDKYPSPDRPNRYDYSRPGGFPGGSSYPQDRPPHKGTYTGFITEIPNEDPYRQPGSQHGNRYPSDNKYPDQYPGYGQDRPSPYPSNQYPQDDRHPSGSGDYDRGPGSKPQDGNWNYGDKDGGYKRTGGSYPPYRGGQYYTSSYLASASTPAASQDTVKPEGTTQPSLESKK